MIDTHNDEQKPLKWAVVIPAYNEALTIESLIETTLLLQPTQLIVVNDCSNDNTAQLLSHFPITLLHNNKNLGKAASLWKGFTQALKMNMDVVISLDGDGQHDPNDIPRLLQKQSEHPNKIIIASRKRNPDSQPFARFFANKFANFWVSWAAGYRISDSQSGFRSYPTLLLKNISNLQQKAQRYEQSFVFESEVLIVAAWQGIYSLPVEIEAIYPEQRRASHFKPFKDIINITRMVAKKLLKKNMNLNGLYHIIFNTSLPHNRMKMK